VKAHLHERVAQLEAIVQHITAHRAEQLEDEEMKRILTDFLSLSVFTT